MLRAQIDVVGAVAHDRESVGRDVGRGHGPGRIAPSLIVNGRYIFARPMCPGVKFPWKRIRIVNTPHWIRHFIRLYLKMYKSFSFIKQNFN